MEDNDDTTYITKLSRKKRLEERFTSRLSSFTTLNNSNNSTNNANKGNNHKPVVAYPIPENGGGNVSNHQPTTQQLQHKYDETQDRAIINPNNDDSSNSSNNILMVPSNDAVVGEDKQSLQIPTLQHLTASSTSSTTTNTTATTTTTPTHTFTPISCASQIGTTRPRSFSAGRQRPTSSLVQDVYDRLGVNRDSMMTTKTDTNSSNNNKNNSNNSLLRGRHIDELVERRRAKSVPRQSQQWPPSNQNNNSSEEVSQQQQTSAWQAVMRKNNTTDLTNTSMAAPASSSSANLKQAQLLQDTSCTSPRSRGFRQAANYLMASSTSNNNQDPTNTMNTTNQVTKKIPEPVPSDETEENATKQSLKERMRLFGHAESTPPTRTSTKQTTLQGAIQTLKSRNNNSNITQSEPVSKHPPKINIYEEIRRSENGSSSAGDEEEKKEDSVVDSNSNGNLNNNSTPVTPYWKKSSLNAQEDTPRSNTSSKSAPARSGGGSHLANAFLAAIQSANNSCNNSTTGVSPHVPLPFVPLTEINPNDDDDGATTGNDSMSAVSDDHFSTTRASFLNNNILSATSGHHKKSSFGSWTAERNRVSAYSTPLSPTKRVTESQQQQQLIDERVRARVYDIERRMDDKLQDFLRNLELKMMTRIDELERRMESILAQRSTSRVDEKN